MGGHAFKTDGKRMDIEEAFSLTKEVFESMSKEFDKNEIVVPHFPMDKPDYGDIDFCLATDNSEDWVKRIQKAIGAEEFRGAGSQYSFLVKGKQVDFNLCPEGSQEFARFNTLHSFTGGIMKALVKELGSEFKMNNSGVYKVVGHGVFQKPIMDLLTNDPSVFLKSMDISQSYLNEDLHNDEVIEMFKQSRQMPEPQKSMKRFVDSILNGENKSYSEKLIGKALDSMTEVKSKEDRKDFFMKTMLENGYDPSVSQKLIDNKILSKKIFNGASVSEITGEKGVELGLIMARFKKSFKSEEDMDDFIISASEKEFKKRVLKNVEHKGLSM